MVLFSTRRQQQQPCHRHTVPNNNNNNNNGRQRRLLLRKFEFLCILGVFMVVLELRSISYYASPVEQQQQQQHESHPNNNLYDTTQLCTFQDLQQAYGNHNNKISHDVHSTTTTTTTTSSDGDNNDCWHLSDVIVRIPSNSILYYNDGTTTTTKYLKPLGKGGNGAVFQVILKLSNNNHNNNSNTAAAKASYCTAAFKTDIRHTDYCTNIWRFWKKKRPPQQQDKGWMKKYFMSLQECIRAQVFGFTHVGAEYMGALPFYASRQEQQQQVTFPRGLLPTWAIVVEDQEQQQPTTTTTSGKSTLSFFVSKIYHKWCPKMLQTWFYNTSPHPDQNSILGVIMPFLPVTSIKSMLRDHPENGQAFLNNTNNMTIPILSQKLLVAAEALQYVNDLGLSFQDLSWGNVAFRNLNNNNDKSLSWSHGMVFDNTFMGYQTPTSQQQQSNHRSSSSNFCVEDYFPPPYKGMNWNTLSSNYRGLDHDLLQLKRSILMLLSHIMDTPATTPISPPPPVISNTYSLQQLVDRFQQQHDNQDDYKKNEDSIKSFAIQVSKAISIQQLVETLRTFAQ